jgi:hypothetical protein
MLAQWSHVSGIRGISDDSKIHRMRLCESPAAS